MPTLIDIEQLPNDLQKKVILTMLDALISERDELRTVNADLVTRNKALEEDAKVYLSATIGELGVMGLERVSATREEIKELLAQGRKIDAIKVVRNITGMGLKEALQAVNEYTCYLDEHEWEA